jgi:hypothetical protein
VVEHVVTQFAELSQLQLRRFLRQVLLQILNNTAPLAPTHLEPTQLTPLLLLLPHHILTLDLLLLLTHTAAGESRFLDLTRSLLGKQS